MKKTSLIPAYYQEFSCIGSDCEDNCCHGWTVAIDKKTYKDTVKILDPKWKKDFKQHYKRNKKENNDQAYAYMKMDSCGNCPFLSEKGLCNVHADLGEKYLSHTCVTYPRTFHEVNGVLEASLSISCPEAARVALLNTEKMEFVQTDIEYSEKTVTRNFKMDQAQNEKQYFWDMRVAAITILQDRTYTIEDRLIILGLVTKRVQEAIETKEYDSIPDILGSYLEEMKEGSFRENIENIEGDTPGKIKLYTDVLVNRLQRGSQRTQYIALSALISSGLTGKDNATVQDICEQYNTTHQGIYEPYMKENEHIFENYLVNYVFRNLFPLNADTWMTSYLNMAANFVLLKTQLIGLAGHHKTLDDAIAVRLFYSFSRNFEHDRILFKHMSDFLTKNGYDTFPNLAVLLKK